MNQTSHNIARAKHWTLGLGLIMCACMCCSCARNHTGPAQQQKIPTPVHAPAHVPIAVDQIDQNQDGHLDSQELTMIHTPVTRATWAFTAVMLVMIVTFVTCWLISRRREPTPDTPPVCDSQTPPVSASATDDWLDVEQDFLGVQRDPDADHWLDSGQWPDR